MSKERIESAEHARLKAQQDVDEAAQEAMAKLASETKSREQQLSLQQAVLRDAASDASKSMVPAKPAGIAGQYEWVIKPADESSEDAIRKCYDQAFAARPEFFDLSPRLKRIKDALKLDPKLEIPGLKFDRVFKTRPT